MKEPEYKKTYVPTNIHFTTEGQMHPRSLEWTDGIEYEVDGVKDIKPAAALKAGGQGDRYTILMKGIWRYIFLSTIPNMAT